MAKKRTKKDKQRSSVRKNLLKKEPKANAVELSKPKLTSKKELENNEVSQEVAKLFSYPTKLIYQDLFKTLLVSAIVLVLLITLAIFY